MDFAEKEDGPLAISEAQVITRATVVAARTLGLSHADLASVIGISEDEAMRMERLDHLLRKGTGPFDLSLRLLGLFRTLTAAMAGDAQAARHWFHEPDREMGCVPAERIAVPGGLDQVLVHLKQRSAFF